MGAGGGGCWTAGTKWRGADAKVCRAWTGWKAGGAVLLLEGMFRGVEDGVEVEVGNDRDGDGKGSEDAKTRGAESDRFSPCG